MLAVCLFTILLALNAALTTRNFIRSKRTAYVSGYFVLQMTLTGCGVYAVWIEVSSAMKGATARAQVHDLARLVSGYVELNGQWPHHGTNGDVRYGEGTFQNFTSAILSQTNYPVAFQSRYFKNGVIYDPWGEPYNIVIDTDGDGHCTISGFGRIDNVKVVVWSNREGQIASWNKFSSE